MVLTDLPEPAGDLLSACLLFSEFKLSVVVVVVVRVEDDKGDFVEGW